MSGASKTRKNAYRFGRLGEHLACLRLRLTGYRVVRRGYRAVTGEIDIIARRRSTLAFIEVKARGTLNDALHALGAHQRRRIERTALAFLAGHRDFANLDARFDLIILIPWRWPRHLKGAWISGE